MASLSEYDELDGVGLAALVASGDTTAAELLEAAIERAEALNPAINAIIEPMYDRARAQVSEISPGGPFGGVPFLMKDLGAAVAGVPLRNGSRFFRDYVPAYDAEMVKRLHAAGLVTFGKTSSPELGLVGTTEPDLFGPTRNPWNLECTPGGSSGGSGAAVAAGIVPLASAGDGGGSIRIPAACNGLVGLKPSRGRNPSGPEMGEGWYGQVQSGVISRTVRDTAVALDATAGGDVGMPYCAPPPALRYADCIRREPPRLRIAVCRQALCCEAEIDAECLRGLDHATELLGSLGHELEEANPPLDRMLLGTSFLLRVLACTAAEIADAERLLGRRSAYGDFEPMTRAFANLARSFDAVELTLANRNIEREVRKLGVFMAEYDILLTPTLATPPARLGVFDPTGLDAVLTAIASRTRLGPLPRWGGVLEQLVHNNFNFVVSSMLANMSGEPSISLPLHWSADELPVGMMFTAPIYREDVLLMLAAQLEQAQPWSSRRPPLHATS